ncbi:oligosaccharide flippase family protein [Flavobacterium sp. 14A]|uniref:oligosaccharide flippase family protein n=1 Tax=Flavobacterium sp. 14A TaxID=2735896 RepID=UPI00156FA3A3|nr:oligosaccharide flippase family protein [Flavobacterium sp. 14A]NRT10963.1 O-antigen/teichoic acid export membrane protein [Flavobacterium sp. 14A]
MNTFIKHTFIYFLSKGLPGILSFLAILYYSKNLSPEDYGIYSLIISVVGIVNIVCFDWFRFGMSRFLPEYIASGERDVFLLFVKNKMRIAILIFSVICFLWYLAIPLLPNMGIDREFILYIGVLVVLQYVFTLLTQIFITELKPKNYMWANFIRSFFAVVVSVLFVYLGFGYLSLIIGAIASFLFSTSYSLLKINFPKNSASLTIDKVLLIKITQYSLPLSASAGLSFFLSYSNRFIINHYRSVEETGLFSLGFDFSQQTIGVFISIAATSAFPIAMKLFTEHGNTEKLHLHMNKSLLMIFFIALPIVIIFCSTSVDLSNLILGEKFSRLDNMFLPIVSVNAFVLGIKSYYFDLFFYLKKETKLQMLILLAVTTINISLNLIFVPQYGYIAAVWCSSVTSTIAVVGTYFATKKIIYIPIDFVPIFKIILAALFMFITMQLYGNVVDVFWLAIKVGSGVLIFLCVVIIINKRIFINILKSLGIIS